MYEQQDNIYGVWESTLDHWFAESNWWGNRFDDVLECVYEFLAVEEEYIQGQDS